MADASSIFGGTPAPANGGTSGTSIFGGTATPSAPVTSKSIFGNAPTAQQTHDVAVQKATQEAQVGAANAKYQSSFLGTAVNTLKGLWDATGIPGQFNSGVQQVKDALNPQNKPGALRTSLPGSVTGVQRGIQAGEGALNVGSGIVTAAFSPLAPLFQVFSGVINSIGGAPDEVPNSSLEAIVQNHLNAAHINKQIGISGVGSINDLINSPAVQHFANSPAGDTTSRIVQDIANASNIGLAAFGGVEGLKQVLRGEKPIPPEAIPKGATETPSVAPETAPETPQKPLAQTHAEYAKSQGYEPYTPDSELPVIDAGKATKSDLPTIQAEAPAAKPVKGDLTIVPEPEVKIAPAQAPEIRIPTFQNGEKAIIPEKPSSVPFSAEKPVSSDGTFVPLKPAESTGEAKVSKLASGVNENAVARKLTDTIGELPEYNQVSMKEQADYASHLIANEPDRALRIAMGQEMPPAHILPEAVFTALEDKATREGDVATLRKLGTESNLSSQATAMGQRIRALGERDSLSAVDNINKVKTEREAAAEKKNPGAVTKAKKEIADTITKEIKKGATRQSWEDFAKSLACDY